MIDWKEICRSNCGRGKIVMHVSAKVCPCATQLLSKDKKEIDEWIARFKKATEEQ